jgi:hypothetical protein
LGWPLFDQQRKENMNIDLQMEKIIDTLLQTKKLALEEIKLIDKLIEGVEALASRTTSTERFTSRSASIGQTRPTTVVSATPKAPDVLKAKRLTKLRRKRSSVTHREEIRDWIVQKREFTAHDLAEHFEHSEKWPNSPSILPYFVKKGIITYDKPPNRRIARVYRYVPPEPDLTPRQRSTGPELMEDLVQRSTPVPGTGRQVYSSDKDVSKLLASARAQGAQIRFSGNHHIIVSKDGRSITVSASPSDKNAVHNIERDLQKLGCKV